MVYTHIPKITYLKNMFAVQSLQGGPMLWLPNPSTESAKGLAATLVNSGRSANAVITAQKIGRDQNKSEMAWDFLNKEDWEPMLRFWDVNFFFYFHYYSPVAGAKITRKFYVGDRTWQPYDIDDNGDPVAYKNCSANVIDTGEGA